MREFKLAMQGFGLGLVIIFAGIGFSHVLTFAVDHIGLCVK